MPIGQGHKNLALRRFEAEDRPRGLHHCKFSTDWQASIV